MSPQKGGWQKLQCACCRGSVFPKSLAVAVPSAIIAACGNYFFGEGGESNRLSTLVGSFTFILGFMLVFRTQQAYSRWWEGGTLLQKVRGEWFNAYSSVLAFTNEDSRESGHFVHRLALMMSLLYGCALEQSSTSNHEFKILDLKGMDKASLEYLMQAHDRSEIVLQWIQKMIVQAEKEGILNVAPPILSRIYQQLSNGYVNMENARKIKELPIPFPMRQTATALLLLHWLTNTYFCAILSNSPFQGSVAAFVNVFAFWSVNYIAVELENPYGDDPNDLPLESTMQDYNLSLTSLLHQSALSPPLFDPLLAEPLLSGTFADERSASSLSVKRGSTLLTCTVAQAAAELSPVSEAKDRSLYSGQGPAKNRNSSKPLSSLPPRDSRGYEQALAVGDVLLEHDAIKAGDRGDDAGIEPLRQAAESIMVVEACVDRMKRRLSELDAREIGARVECGGNGATQATRRREATATGDQMRMIESSIFAAVAKPDSGRDPDE